MDRISPNARNLLDAVELRARIAALESSQRGVFTGSRVLARIGGAWLHGRVAGAFLANDQSTGLRVRLLGHGVTYEVALADVVRLCGLCPDCMTLNERPECVGSLGLALAVPAARFNFEAAGVAS